MKNDGQLRIAFLLLAHERPGLCARLARHLLATGDHLVVHLDRKAPPDFRDRFEAALDGGAERVSWAERVSVEWGEWSMVEATLNGLRALRRDGVAPDFVYLLSGADYPIRPLAQLRGFLARHRDRDFIEHRDARAERWVQRGPQRERYLYRHWINWRRHPRLFSLSLNLQRRLGLEREFPEGLVPHFGSQWWVLRWETCERVLELASRPEIHRFFRRTWVPDELFFQTAVASLVKPEERDDRHLTHYLFSEYGVPLVFHDDHVEHLVKQPFFFARKLAPAAEGLREALDRRVRRNDLDPPADHRVGRATRDYQRFLYRHRHGIRGQRSWGRPGKHGLGELERNTKPYFVLTGPDPDQLAAAHLALTGGGGRSCHGRLFHGERIEFAGGAEHCAGYRDDDLPIRNQDPLNFLAELLRHSDATSAGFLLGPESSVAVRVPAAMDSFEERDLLTVLARDPNCHVIHLADEPTDDRVFERVRSGGCEGLPPRIRANWTRVTPLPADDGGWGPLLLEALEVSDAGAEPRQSGGDEGAIRRRVPPRLFLHIGVHRTGTTAIQRLLHRNRDALRQQGFHYAFDTENHTWLATDLASDDETAARTVEGILADAEASGLSRVIVSGEDLARLEHVHRLERLREHFEVKVVCYLRRQDSWLESWYDQHVRWPWELDTSRMTPTEFLSLRERFHWLDYSELLMRWATVFGRRNLVVRVYEEAREAQPFTRDFCDICGIDHDRLDPGKRVQNASIAPQATRILRSLGMFSRPNRERMLLIQAVAGACEAAGLNRVRHVLSTATRRRLMQEYARSNAWVAREFLGRADGRLFPKLPDEDEAGEPRLTPPDPETFMAGVGQGVVEDLLEKIVRCRDEKIADPGRDRALLVQEMERRRLKRRTRALAWLLSDRKALARELAGAGALERLEPGLTKAGAPKAEDGPGVRPRQAQWLGEHIDRSGLDERRKAALDRVISCFVDSTPSRGTPGSSVVPDDPDAFLEQVFRPLLDVFIAELGKERLLAKWGEAEMERRAERRSAAIARLERQVREQEAIVASPMRKAGRLIRGG